MKINLYIVHHKRIEIPIAPCLIPIHTERTDGDNIADKKNYCELRAHYWVWKNAHLTDNDYVGFFHYRRYLDFSRGKALALPVQKRPLPYRIVRWPQAEQYISKQVSDCVEGFDAIASIWEYTGISPWKRYPQSVAQHIEDLQLIYQILKKEYPEFSSAADTYLSGKGEYYGNMFLMRWPLFQNYCTWLFSILGEFDSQVVFPMPRTNGFLGERLFGIYFTWLQSQPNVRCGELPRLHFSGYDDAQHRFTFKRVINTFIPPGSYQRSFVRAFLRK